MSIVSKSNGFITVSILRHTVIKEAQDLGYAEADPSADIDGFDIRSKIAILSKLGFGIHTPESSMLQVFTLKYSR